MKNLKLYLLVLFSFMALNIEASSQNIPYVAFGERLKINYNGVDIEFSPNTDGWYRLYYKPTIEKISCANSIILPDKIQCKIEYITDWYSDDFVSYPIMDVALYEITEYEGIGDNALYNCSELTSITIPESVTSIGENAFYGCSGLTSIDIPNSVTSIGSSAFRNCSGLTSVTIGNSVTSIGSYAFYNCSGLTSVTIPNSVTSIGSSAFRYCSGLTSLTIPNSVTSIGENAFYGCSGLTSVTIGNSVTSIGDYAFYNCSGLTSITIPHSVAEIAENALPSNLKRIYIPTGYELTDSSNKYIRYDISEINSDGVELIYKKTSDTEVSLIALEHVDSKLEIPSSITSNGVTYQVTSVANNVFKECTSLKELIIKDGVGTLSLDNDIFSDCPFETLYLGRNLSDYSYHNPSPFSGNNKLTTLTIGNSVTSIGSRAFYGCSGLTSIDIPNSVTSIGDYAFYDCSGLTSIDIPNSVTSIGDYTFDGCSALTSITIPNSVTTIGSCVFYDCSGLTSIDIPNSVTSIGSSAFSHCSGLTSIDIPNSVTSIGAWTFSHCSGLTSITIPNSVTSIGDYAFYDCSGLTSIDIPNSVTSIGEDAFYYCSGLTSIDIPNSVTSIGAWAFSHCSGLTSITIPNSVTSIGDYAFSHCSGLTSIDIPNSITSIGRWAFNGCSGLTSITIPHSVTEIGENALPSTLKRIYIPTEYELTDSSNKYIRYDISEINSDGVKLIYKKTSNTEVSLVGFNFQQEMSIFKLSSSIISNGITYQVTSIGSSAFYGCSGLASVTIPNSVTIIGDDALSGCSSLKELIFEDGYGTLSLENYVNSGKFIDYPLQTLYLGRNINYINRPLNGLFNVSGTLTISNSVTEIADNAFYGCSGLTSINISSRVTLIGDSAFYGCSGLTSINIPESVTSIGKYTFANCSGLSSITIPNSVTTICDYAFHNCDLSTVVLGKRVASIGKYAFSGVGSYSKVDWPSKYVIYSLNVNPPSVERNTFYEGAYYANLIVPVVEKYHGSDWKEELGFVVSDAYGYMHRIYSLTCFENDGIEYSYIGGGRVIVSGADKSITKVNIPNSIANNSSNYDVVGIGDSAFIDCGHLKSVIIPNSVTSIGYSAFYNCDSLTTVLIPNGVETIGENAFSECDMLSLVKIGKNVSYISANPFVNCPKLTTIDIASDNKYLSFENATLYGNDNTEIISLINYNESLYTIAENIRIIYPKAFEGCTSLTTLNYNAVNCVRIGNSNNYVYGDNPTITTINIASNVESIPEFAFDGCTSLTTLNYNAVNCVKMGSSMNPVFGDNPTLTKINIASDVVNIPGYAFKNCPISTITIPDKVTKIGDGVFYNCTLLKEIYSRKSAPAPYIQGGGTFTGVSKTIPIYVPEGSKSSYSSQYGWNEFTNIREVYDKSVSIDGVKYGIDKENIAVVYGANIDIVNVDIKDVVVYEGVEYPVKKISTTAFYMTKDIETITIGNNIDVIPEGAFKNMTNLKKIVIGKNVTTIGDHAFYNCTNIQEIYSKKAGTAPYILGAGTFVGVSKTIPLYIPEGSYSSYSTQYGWSDFTNKKEVYEKTVFINGITYGLSKEGVAVVVDVHKDVKKAEIENMVEIDGDEYPVTTIIEGSFAFAKKIITLIIGNNITSIPKRAFENSYSLKLVIIGENVTSIGDYAFYNCNGIKEINSGKAGTAPYILGGSTFAGVNKTIPIYVPEGSHSAYIKQYGWSDFSNFKVANYKTIEIEGIKYRVSEDDTYAYVEKVNTSITDANIKDYITIYDNQYPVTEINSEMFTLCSNLSSAIIPSYMEKIGEQAFYACYNVKEIYSLNSTPPMCDMYAFYGIDLSIPVYIPYGSKSAYQAAAEWKDFTCFIESEFTGVEEEEISTSDIKVISGNGIEINDYYGRIRIVNLAGQVIKDVYVNGSIQISLPKGIYIVVTENNSQKVIL